MRRRSSHAATVAPHARLHAHPSCWLRALRSPLRTKARMKRITKPDGRTVAQRTRSAAGGRSGGKKREGGAAFFTVFAVAASGPVAARKATGPPRVRAAPPPPHSPVRHAARQRASSVVRCARERRGTRGWSAGVRPSSLTKQSHAVGCGLQRTASDMGLAPHGEQLQRQRRQARRRRRCPRGRWRAGPHPPARFSRCHAAPRARVRSRSAPQHAGRGRVGALLRRAQPAGAGTLRRCAAGGVARLGRRRLRGRAR